MENPYSKLRGYFTAISILTDVVDPDSAFLIKQCWSQVHDLIDQLETQAPKPGVATSPAEGLPQQIEQLQNQLRVLYGLTSIESDPPAEFASDLKASLETVYRTLYPTALQP